MDTRSRIDDIPLDPDLALLFAELERRMGASQRPTLRAWLECAEAWRIAQALEQSRGNRSAAARSLGIGRRTLYTKMEKLGIQPRWGAAPVPRPSNGAAGPGTTNGAG